MVTEWPKCALLPIMIHHRELSAFLIQLKVSQPPISQQHNVAEETEVFLQVNNLWTANNI